MVQVVKKPATKKGVATKKPAEKPETTKPTEKPVAAKKASEKPVAAKKKPVDKSAVKKKPVVKQQTKKPSSKDAKKTKKVDLKYVVECADPVGDDIFVVNNFVDFLKETIKFNNKKGNLAAGGIEISAQGKTQAVVTAKSELSKRYLKYLTKKYLKRHKLRDWIRVIASAKDTYELRYFKIEDEEKMSSDEE